MDTYTLVARETSTHDGIDVDVVDEDGLVETTTQVTYEDYDVVAERDSDGPEPVEEEFTVDAGSLELELTRDERTFVFHALADADEAARVVVSDSDWNLLHT